MTQLRGRVRAACAAMLAVLLAFGAAPAAPAAAAPSAPAPHTVGYDHYSLTVDGKRTYLWGAEFHYWRLPSPSLWRDVLQKMKASGFNAVSIYFDWAYHSPAPGRYDFSGIRDIDLVLKMAQEAGLYVVARPGPYINAETDSGGFPAWVDQLKGRSRSSDADFQAASDEWLTAVDKILAKHLYTKGTGPIILYQIENEYGVNTDAAYMAHTEQLVRSHGIDVPLTHNHCCGTSTWATGTGAVDLTGRDSYPQNFNCSNPTVWHGVDTLPRYRDDTPIYAPEYQGGAFDPWGGPGYEKCRQLTGPDFENVFYKNNIASGATMQSFYMTYGGTSWGWLADPGVVYTSYDYGAAIAETRQLTTKYDELKRIGYFVGAVQPLTKTDAFAATPPTNPSIIERGRLNPDDGTQFLTLRHTDATSTATDDTHIAVDLAARTTYTWDDADAPLTYEGSWGHAGSEVNWTAGDYKTTESYSDVAGDSVSVPFTGTAVRWISSRDSNHGIADVYLDGTKVATVDTYGSAKATQQVFYDARGLTDGPHTLKIVATGTKNAAAAGTFVVVDAIDLPPAGATLYPSVPQQAGTAITLAGRQSKIIVANYALGSQRLVYSTSEIMTHARIGARDVALLYGGNGQAGETVLRYAAQPSVSVLSGDVQSTWDAARGDLRLNYTHSGLARVLVTPAGGGTPLLLLLTTDSQAATFWRYETSAGPVLVRGPSLVRTAEVTGGDLRLTGDTKETSPLEVFAPPGVKTVRWNGTPAGASLAGPKPVTLPALTGWRYHEEAPEAAAGFDDSAWAVADHLTTDNPTVPAVPPVLYTDDYGFHHGDVWYRARFRGTPAQTGVNLNAITGRAGVYSAWLNGVYLGSSANGGGSTVLPFPAGALRAGADNVLAVLVENMGHNQDGSANDANKEPRGLTAASVVGAPLTSLTWRLQGNAGGEQPVDAARGMQNVTGLYGQRAGWSLPGYPDGGWKAVSLPHTTGKAGVGWYRTTVNPRLPAGQDTSVGIRIDDDAARRYRAQIYVNGWNLGRYINDLGPQHSFPIPNGILRTNGVNTIAIAAWGVDKAAGLGKVSLESYGTSASSLTVDDVASPGYTPATYPAAAPATATLTMAAPDTAKATQEVVTWFAVPKGQAAASRISVKMTVPSGWTAIPRTPPASPGIPAGGTFGVRWVVKAPAGTLPAASFLRATARFTQAGRQRSVTDTRAVRSTPQAPTADAFVSDLPFLSATNGWGPVERDKSNGENAAGDGRTITIGGTTYAKGLGAHADSTVAVYLGGRCSSFTAVAGVDDEVGNGGTVRFHVLADGVERYASPVQTGAAATGTAVTVNTTGAQQLDLVVDDGGDGNGQDHADWAAAKLTCA